MGQKVNPTGFRVGITEDWKSKWYAPKAAFSEFLAEDFKLRTYIDRKLNRRPPFAAVADILIERTREEVTLTTLQANVDYGYAIAYTTYGTIGVKTWIFRGMYGEEVLETDVRPGGGPRRGRR